MTPEDLRGRLAELFAEAIAEGLDWQDIDDACQEALADGEDPAGEGWLYTDEED